LHVYYKIIITDRLRETVAENLEDICQTHGYKYFYWILLWCKLTYYFLLICTIFLGKFFSSCSFYKSIRI